MDPLSTIASVAGIVSLILPVATSVKEFYVNCKHQNEQVAQVLRGLSQLERMLNMTEDHIGKREFDPEQGPTKTELEELVQLCEESIKALQHEYSQFGKPTRRWEYPFRKSTLERLKEDIDDIVEHLFRILALLEHQDIDTVRRQAEGTHWILKLVRADQISSSIRDWLKAPDATVDYMYNKADEKRHPNTGLWFLEGPAFSSWLSSGNSFLWLYGFAVVESVGFFFFTFRDESKQDSSAMLRSLVLQLSAQLEDDHKLLSEVYDSHYRHGTPPDKILVECLEKLVRSFDRTFLVLDALDEVPNDGGRKKVLKVVSTMREWSIPGLHLLVTSRDEHDIRTSLFPGTETTSEQAISLKNAQINADILSYVSHFLKTDSRLEWIKMHHHDWVDGIVKQISDRAGGVFRLAECHLRSLQQCLKAKKYLKRALESLPKSLDETYERMLDQVIQNGHEDQARRLFIILCLSRKPLGVQEVLDFMAVELGNQPYFDQDARLEDETELCHIAPGLVELQDNGHGVRIAHFSHFSVQEYLLCDRISASKVRAFWISPDVAHGDMASICIPFLQQPVDKDLWSRYTYASRYWTTHAYLANPKPPALSAILSKPEEIPFKYPEALLTRHDWPPDSVTEESICWLVEQGVPVNICDGERITLLHYAVLNRWPNCVKTMLARGAQITTDDRDMTPFHYSVVVQSTEIAQVFLDADVPVDLGIRRRHKESGEAQVNNPERRCFELAELPTPTLQPKDLRSLTPLNFAALYGSEIMTSFLLEKGANPNIQSEHGETPLHVALKGELYRPPRMLLMGSDDDGSNAIWAAVSSLGLYPEEALNEWYRGSLEGRADSLRSCFDCDDPEYQEAVERLRQNQAKVAGLILSPHSTNTNAQDNHGKTPLHVAIEVKDELSVAALLVNGANVFDTDKDGLNALHYAARTGEINIIRSVVESTHDTSELKRLGESTDNQERNVLQHIATKSDAFDGLTYLLQHVPVDVNHLDKEGDSPLATLLRRGCRLSEKYADMAAMLFAWGADPTLKFTIKENDKTFDGFGLGHLFAHEFGLSLQGLESKTLEVLAGYGVHLGALDGQGRSIIHHGVLGGSLTKELLDYLCNEVGLSLGSLDAYGKTPLDYAEEESRKTRPWYIFDPERWSRTRDLLVDYQDAKTQSQDVLVAGK